MVPSCLAMGIVCKYRVESRIRNPYQDRVSRKLGTSLGLVPKREHPLIKKKKKINLNIFCKRIFL